MLSERACGARFVYRKGLRTHDDYGDNFTRKTCGRLDASTSVAVNSVSVGDVSARVTTARRQPESLPRSSARCA